MRCKGKLLKSPFRSWLAWGAVAVWMLIANPTPMVADESGPLAPTFDGVYRGVSTPTMNEFLGIRYAQAPVGDLRGRPPRAPERVPGIQDATQFANHCPQPASPFGVASDTEDCLFLNVYTPVRRGKFRLHSVMFWIHGGALFTGESDDYNPERPVQQGVVVVTINYRLGALGFLAHPALGAEDGGPSGNYGLMDQQLAMKWVRRNIAFFGGDPSNITIFGQSAGGLSTFSNLVSPLAEGLFQRAIVESGAYSLTLPSLTTAEAQGELYAAAEGCTSQTAACLRALTVAQVLADENQNSSGYVTNVDGKFFLSRLTPLWKPGSSIECPS